MGGYGSTRWGHTPTKHHTGACLRLDIAVVRPHLADDRPSLIWRWPWANGGEATLGMATAREGIALSYTCRHGQGGPVPVRDAVGVEWTVCTHGGERPWFRCPGCDRRVRALYLPPGHDHFRCRHCHRLAYGSQQVAPDERHLLAIRKLQRRLGGDPAGVSPSSLPARPGGMHRRTYERLSGALVEHQTEREAILVGQMERLLARSDRILGQRSAGR